MKIAIVKASCMGKRIMVANVAAYADVQVVTQQSYSTLANAGLNTGQWVHKT